MLALNTQVPLKTPPPPIAKEPWLLALYFQSEVTLGDKSPLGPMLERAELYSAAWKVCKRCDGSGIDSREEDKWMRSKRAFDLLYPDAPAYETFRPPPESESCKSCRGTGAKRAVRRKEEETARPSGTQHGGEPPEANDDAVLRVARASRVMLRVGNVSQQHLAALLVYHGAPGDHCDGNHANRLISLIPLVSDRAAGQLRSKGVLEVYRRLAEASRRTDRERERYLVEETAAHLLLVAATTTWDSCLEV
jgi:hypothetical protein